ncbi:TIGR02569 family protein [Actinophytocola xinjiangensis]|uniref:TIGR02569 family protein n=1 Tax=Actinophytocola xinjiangensis TaxID=485602 RepID=A0A7Z0WKY0_9PSEU|nr:TIGR02569 family protein [Actinophytocola xinjiangensis]OLF09037.1 TIGR02569 family protein [Actinophytocola xinjiangensis]
MATSNPGPAPAVLAAFGISGDPVPLPGGQGGTWRAGALVLKPVEFAAETQWRSQVLAALPDSPEFRISRPVRTVDGAWIAHGWEAGRLVVGAPDVSRTDDVLRAAHAFHAALAHLRRPVFLDRRDNPWSVGDRVAWNELPARTSPPATRLLEPLVRARRPVTLAAQVVHGDLPGNVLFADGLPPAIIDWPVYWRPPAWAYAIAVADALCWYGASPALAARWSHLPDWDQMLLRALIFRIVTHDTVFGPTGWTPDQLDAHRPAIDLAVRG